MWEQRCAKEYHYSANAMCPPAKSENTRGLERVMGNGQGSRKPTAGTGAVVVFATRGCSEAAQVPLGPRPVKAKGKCKQVTCAAGMNNKMRGGGCSNGAGHRSSHTRTLDFNKHLAESHKGTKQELTYPCWFLGVCPSCQERPWEFAPHFL